MIKIDHIKKFPFAEKYLFNTNGLNLTSFSKRIQKRVLNEVTIDDVKFIDKIYLWKESVLQGNDIPCPTDKIDFRPSIVRSSKLSLIWKIVEYTCCYLIIPVLLIFAFFIWGILDIKLDYHILIIFAIIVVLSLIIRLFIHIRLVKNIRILERLFPFVAVQSNVTSKSAAKKLFLSFGGDSPYEEYSRYFCPDYSYFVRLNTFISVYYDLIKNAISLYPEKILLYYKYGKNNSAVYKYREVKSPGLWGTDIIMSKKYGYKNIFNILQEIDKQPNLEFLSSIIMRSEIEKIIHSELDIDLERFFNIHKDYLLKEGEFQGNPTKWVDKKIFATYDTYQFKKDNYFRKYAIILSVFGIVLLGFYPAYFRYHYVQNQLAENEYKILMEEYEVNHKRLYDLESVNLVISTRNSMEYNNHVGNSWGYKNIINNVEVNNNKTLIPYHYGDPINLQTVIVEYDSWNDVSSRVDTINCSKEDLIEGVKVAVDSYVYENRGRYSGYHAKWTSLYFIEVEKPNKPIYQNIKIPASEVILNFFKSF